MQKLGDWSLERWADEFESNVEAVLKNLSSEDEAKGFNTYID